jgi:hypothetical protein
MLKKMALVVIAISLVVAGIVVNYDSSASFFCESDFSVVQNINDESIHSEGVISFEITRSTIFINIDGLLTDNDKKYIISRNIKAGYKKYNNKLHGYKLFEIKQMRDESDNINDALTNKLLFGSSSGDKIIYLNKLNNNLLLIGNHTFPQYGCRRQ